MKLQIVKLMLFCILIGYATTSRAQLQTDPILTAAVTAENAALSNKLKDQNDKQLTIIGINTGIMLQLDSIRKYENIMYNYLKEGSNAIRNAYDIYRCGELISSIYSNLNGCTNAISNHPQGAIVSAVVSKQYSKIINESTALYGYIASIVKKNDGSVLLNTAERNNILVQVTSRLSTINRNLRALKYQIMIYRWTDIPRLLAPVEYYMLVDSRRIVNGIKRDIDRMSR